MVEQFKSLTDHKARFHVTYDNRLGRKWMDGLWRSHTKNKGKHVSKPNRIKVILCWFCCRAGPTTVTSFSLLSMCGKPRLMEGHRVCVLVFWATESLDSKTKSSSVTLTCRQQWDNTFRWNTSSCFYWLSWWCFLLILWWWRLWRAHCSLSQSYMSESGSVRGSRWVSEL